MTGIKITLRHIPIMILLNQRFGNAQGTSNKSTPQPTISLILHLRVSHILCK